MWFVRIKLLSSSKDFNSTFHFINSIITHYLVHANNFSEASTDAHSRSSREALMATKKIIAEKMFLRRQLYIGYAYAKVWAWQFSKKRTTLMNSINLYKQLLKFAKTREHIHMHSAF